MVLPKKPTSPESNEYVIPSFVEAFLKWIVAPLLTSKLFFNEVLFWNANVRVALFVTFSLMFGLEMYVVSLLISLPWDQFFSAQLSSQSNSHIHT